MARRPVVVDTDVYSARFVPNSPLALRYEPLLVGRLEVLSFQTVAEVRYGAPLRGWGAARLRRLEVAITGAEVVHSGPDLIGVYAEFRVACERIGHALCQREHDADRWVALRLGISLVSNDRIFEGAPGLVLEALR